MSVDPLELTKAEAPAAAEVHARYEPSPAATELLADGMAPGRFLEYLLHAGLLEDSLSFLAYALPTRDAIWWGLRCVREVTPAEPAEPIAAAITAAETWLMDPSDENRRQAMVAAEEATYETPAGCLDLAVFFSEGSMAPPDCPAVPVGEGFSARTLFAAVHMATLTCGPEPAGIETAARNFAQVGIECAREPGPWDPEAPTQPASSLPAS